MYLRWSIRRDKMSERWEDLHNSHIRPHNEQVKRDYQKLFGIYEDNMDWDQIQEEIYYRDNKLALTQQSEDFEFSMDSRALDFNNVRLLGEVDYESKEEVNIINHYTQQQGLEGQGEEIVFQNLLEVGHHKAHQQSH